MLREDLLDEAKLKPKTSTEAYQAAYQLCTSLMDALIARDRSSLQAGYRLIEATRFTPATNQALEARRNYLMSWPQYHREQKQRQDVSRVVEGNDQKNKDLAQQRTKIEWQASSEKTRRNLTSQYAALRQALREAATVALDEKMPANWSYLTTPGGVACGWVVFTQDGKAELTGRHKNPDSGVWETKKTLGTWTKGKKLNQLIVTFPDYGGLGKKVSWDVTIEDGIGKMATDVGVRYLKPTP